MQNASHHVRPFVQEVTGLDPWQTCQQLSGLPHLLFLDSALVTEAGRYSFIAADPFLWFQARGSSIVENGIRLADANPWQVLEKRLAQFHLESIEGLPPFQGGAAGLLGYELGHHLEVLPRTRYDDFQIPDLGVGFYDWVIAFDHSQGRAWIISTGFPATTPQERQSRSAARLDDVKRLLDGPVPQMKAKEEAPAAISSPTFPINGTGGLRSNFTSESYQRAVGRAIEYVHAGDCFQVNIAQRLLMPIPCLRVGLATYGELRRRNPAPFAGYFNMGDFEIASASPERFLRLENGSVESRPIKGTRPRSDNPDEDRALAAALCASAKDRAENVMIVDLIRNDLGRVCEYGSINVEALCRLENFRHVHHLVSEVHGRMRPGLGAVDLLRAAFPGGSVTGAPKIRAMEIITELEQVARGPYCGCLGYFGFNGAMDTNLLIRTLILGKGWSQFSVGGGIVADSDPEREFEETWHKAKGLMDVLIGDREK